MTCFRCGVYPRRLREYAAFGRVIMRERENAPDDGYWLCPRCFGLVRDLIWDREGGERDERMDAPPGAEPENIPRADAGGEMVLQRPDADEKAELGEIWDEIRFR